MLESNSSRCILVEDSADAIRTIFIKDGKIFLLLFSCLIVVRTVFIKCVLILIQIFLLFALF